MVRIACCRPTAYAPGGVLVHSPLCERRDQPLTRPELELWHAKAREPKAPPIIRWRAIDRDPPKYWDSDPEWQEVDDDGYLGSESL